MKRLLCLWIWVFGARALPCQNLHVQHLELQIQFNWTKKQVIGSATFSLTLLKDSDSLALDAGFLDIHSVTENGKPLRFLYDGGDGPKNLVVRLGKIYPAASNVCITVNYNSRYENRSNPEAIGGSFGKGLRFMEPTRTTPNKRKQVWSSGEPGNNKYWFPCNEDLGDSHSTEIVARVEKPLYFVSNGNLLSIKDNPDNTRTFHYKSESAFPNYLVSVAAGDYSKHTQTVSGKNIYSFGYADEEEALKASTEQVPDMLRFLEEKTAFGFPFSAYKQVTVQDYPFPGPVGQYGLALLSDNYVDDKYVHKDFKYLWDGVAVQALANQWFGNLIQPTHWNDIWLNNAFAQYFAGLYTEKDNSRTEYLLWYYPFERGNVLGDWQSGNRHPIVPETIEDLNTFCTDGYSRYKGALVLRMLHQELGDDSWWKCIRLYVKEKAYKQVTTRDFQNCVEKVTGKSYQWFFDQWIYEAGLPHLQISKTYQAAAQKLLITVRQKQNFDTNNSYKRAKYFSGKLLVEIDGRVELTVLKAQDETSFLLPCDEDPSFVNFNFEQIFLCETDFKKSRGEYMAQLKQSKDVLARLEALNQLVYIANDSTVNTDLKRELRSLFSQQINSQNYWRYNMTVLNAYGRITSPPYDQNDIDLFSGLIAKDSCWVKATAIALLGKTKDPQFFDLYVKALEDKSDRVINAAAIAIGKTKDPRAYEILMSLEGKRSWKNQNRISALNGLQQLGDERALDYVLECIKDNHSPRWYLGTPVWDYPFAAVNCLVTLGKPELAYPFLFERFKKSLEDNDVNDIFQNVQLLDLLKDKRGTEVYTLLKEKFKSDRELATSINTYEKNFLESIR